MANLANLVVKIRADDKDLNKRIATAGARIKSFSAKAIKAITAIGVVGVAALSASFVKLTASMRDTQNQLDALGKFGRVLGLSLGEMQEYEFIAKRNGIATEEFAKAIQDMLNNLGQGSDAFTRLGLDITNLKSLKTAELFNTVGRALSNLSSKAEQVGISRAIFGEQGGRVVQVFSGNIGELTTRFRQLRGVISEIELKNIEAANNQFTDLGVIIDGIKDKVAANLAPAFLAFGKIIEATIKEYGGIGEVTNNVTIAVLSGIQAMIGAFQALGAAIDSIKFGFMAIQNLLLQTQKTALTVLSVLPKALRGGLAGVNIKEAQAVIAQTQEGLAKRGAALTRETPSPISDLLSKFQQSLTKTRTGLPSAAPGTPSGIVPQQKIIMEITVNSTETTEIANLQATEAFKTGQLQLNIKQVQNTARQVAR